MSEDQAVSLLNLIGLQTQSIQKNLYRGSRDGFSASSFHSKCDNKTGTLTIIKSTNGNIFGGFTTQNWFTNYPQFKSDSSAYIFSLINLNNNPSKFKIKPNSASNAIFVSPTIGPTFGFGFDIFIATQSNKAKASWSVLGSTYQLPLNFPVGSVTTFLAGTPYFQTSEVEVYLIKRN